MSILKQHQKEVNEIRAKRQARTAKPLALELEAQYMNNGTNFKRLLQIHVDNSGPNFDQPESVNDIYLKEQGDTNITIDSLDMCYDKEHDDTNELDQERSSQAELDKYHDVNYASKVEIDCSKAKGDLMSYKIESEKSSNEYTQKINDLNQMILDMKKELFAHQETISVMSQEKEAQIKFYKTQFWKALQKHAINLELDLQQCKEKIKNDKSFKENQSKEFLKEREQYFEIQDLKAQLQEKGIAISELKKLIEKMKGKSHTHFLRSKDKTPEVLTDFLTLIPRGLHAQVRIVRTDKGIKFMNKTLHAFFAKEGIRHETSTARTPEQNGVVERRNRTLVEAARTMLSAAKVPLFSGA
ncbi:retrovirus-related pol polyprotein from transposon TNT 1-94 [Tanacetum coccineum]